MLRFANVCILELRFARAIEGRISWQNLRPLIFIPSDRGMNANSIWRRRRDLFEGARRIKENFDYSSEKSWKS